MIGVLPPKLSYNNFVEQYYTDRYGTHIKRNKIVHLNINTFQFIDYTAQHQLSFDENLFENAAQKLTEKDLAAFVSQKRFPLRVLSDKTKPFDDFEEFYLINIGV